MTTTYDDVAVAPTTLATATWIPVCRLDDVQRERPVCALVEGRQVAVVRTFDDELYAVSQRDPFSGAFIMSRGIVGSRGVGDTTTPTLQSPLFKQTFDLRTGRCLDDDTVAIAVHGSRERDGIVEVTALPLSVEGTS